MTSKRRAASATVRAIGPTASWVSETGMIPARLTRPRVGRMPTSALAEAGEQGNRVKKLCGDKACEEVVIPGGDFAAESEGILSPGSPDLVEGHVFDGGAVGWGVLG